MRNPALHLVGIATSPGAGGVYGSRAEEELRQWLEIRLDALGIDPIAYSRFVLSLLRRPNSALSPSEESLPIGRNVGRRLRSKAKLQPQGDREQRRTVVECLTSAADNKCGVESLVDELCTKLRDLEGASSNDETEECNKSESETKPSMETLTPRDRALRYYAAFPALQPSNLKKFSQRKDKNSGNNSCNYKNSSNNNINNNNNNNNNNSNHNNNNNIKNNGISYNNNKNNRTRNKKTKISSNFEAQRSEDKDTFGFAKSMELEREKERELELDQLRLAQLQAKFDQSLEALWDSGPGNSQDTASIWAAPTLSIPSGPLWPTETEAPFVALSTSDHGYSTETPYQESIIDDSPLIPWDIDLINIEDFTDECSNNKDKSEYNLNWSDPVSEGPWYWKGLNSSNLASLSYSPQANSCFFPVIPRKSPVGTSKDTRSTLKVTSLTEPDEDLLTSAKTHFRPIKDDGPWADGTTFPVNDSLEVVAYRRSESGHLLYLPGGESPYMEYREDPTTSSSTVKNDSNSSSTTSKNDASTPSTNTNILTLKFRVRQCDKCVQTDPIRSPVKRRILSEQERFYYSPNELEKAPKNLDEDEDYFVLDQLNVMQANAPFHNDRKRRHSSSFGCQPVTTLRPLTL
ncbi:hybrid signal transduction histidine kinase G-like [Prorops nasuta]|uniref:hybrid signal transduction histidine kinase G-like n=1 Tax=Prorops nasuta TaxID=863751 RepID=UPI0034CFBDC0